MSPPQAHDRERADLLRRAAILRTDSRLLREASSDTRELSAVLCAGSRALRERCASSSAEAGDESRPPLRQRSRGSRRATYSPASARLRTT